MAKTAERNMFLRGVFSGADWAAQLACSCDSRARATTWLRRGLASMLLVTCGAAWQEASAAGPAKFMMRARVDGRMLEGQPLWWSTTQMMMLGRDGALYEFNPKQAKESQKTSPRFFGYEMREMKPALYRQFGRDSDITTTQHYIVVHPAGQKSTWADRFEKLYRSFVHYFRVRGFQPRDPKFPLVAVVFRTQREYYAHAAKQGSPLQQGTLGHYDTKSNQIFLFDTTTSGGKWSDNAETIIHEATHQTAFNTGIHARFGGSPRWLVEGLATMFEAQGVWDSRSYQTQRDRINVGRLRDFKDFVKSRRREGFLQELIASDKAFRSDGHGAYAEAWALSFYLCETQPRKYCQYLARTARRESFTQYSASERVADFQAIFGKNLRWIEAQFLKYMEGVN